MPTRERAPSKQAAPNGLTAATREELGGARGGSSSSPPSSSSSSSPSSPSPLPAAGRDGLGRERVVDIQRARMLAAMFDVVAERGAANASVAHVVARSGVSRRTFYELFEDREDCLLAAFDEAVLLASECVVGAYETGGGWRERIRASLAALLQFLDDQPAMGRLLVVEILGAGPRGLERRARVLARIVSAVDQGRAEAKPGKLPPPLTAEGVVGAVFSVIHTRMLPGPDVASPSSPTVDGRGLASSLSSTVPSPDVGSPRSPTVLGPGVGSSLLPAGRQGDSLLQLTGPLMSMIVLPYLGGPAARKELERPVPHRDTSSRRAVEDPLRDLEMRLTYRTVRVLMAIAAHPCASNRQVAEVADVSDQGQMSKLLARLQHLGLIENAGTGSARGEPNAWTLTPTGHRVEQTIHEQALRFKG
jgi:AcrR family transcriptional regulator/DNA-binding MarR family transcriptional regulator